LWQRNPGHGPQERLPLTGVNILQYTRTRDRNLQAKLEQVLQMPLPSGLVSELSKKHSGTGNKTRFKDLIGQVCQEQHAPVEELEVMPDPAHVFGGHRSERSLAFSG
jgi:hypothetical protein